MLGYFFYTALFAAVGSVCNSEQEAQNLQTPVVMCLVILFLIPVMIWLPEFKPF